MVRREPPAWRTVESPTESTLYDVVSFASGAIAVGEDGAVVGRPTGESWQTVLEQGPGASSSNLRAVAATAEGARVWFAGESGALGSYDVASAVKRDFSGPDGHTGDWRDVAVVGSANDERVYLADDSGNVLRITISDRSLDVGQSVAPPSMGSSAAAIAGAEDGTLWVLSSGGQLFSTEDGEEWTTLELGHSGFVDAVTDGTTLYMTDSQGTTYRYDGRDVSAFPVGSPSVNAVGAVDDRVLTVGTAGAVSRRVADGWVHVTTDTEKPLHGLALGATVEGTDPQGDVAVGAGGTVVERRELGGDGDDEPERAGDRPGPTTGPDDVTDLSAE